MGDRMLAGTLLWRVCVFLHEFMCVCQLCACVCLCLCARALRLRVRLHVRCVHKFVSVCVCM